MSSIFSGKFLPWVVAILVVAVWGETFVSSKVILERGLTPADVFFYRFTIAYLLIWLISPRRIFARSLGDELVMALLGVSGGSAYFLMENTALVYSTASNVAILVGSAPLATALMVALFYREERMTARQLLGSGVAFAGMAMVVMNGQTVLHLNPKGDALAIAAALTWGIYSLLIRRVSDRYDTVFITRKVFFYGVLTIVPYFFFVAPLNFDPAVLGQVAVWGNILYLGVVASMLCYVGWNWALARIGTVKTTNLIYCQCFFTMLVAHLVLGEQITAMALVGTVVLVLGMTRALR
jgi:Permeases of the drug/metabolite transporter (DMT) superfamily